MLHSQIMQDEPFLNAAVDVLQQHRNLLLINNLLQVLLELDLGCTLYFVSKACEREAETAGTSLEIPESAIFCPDKHTAGYFHAVPNASAQLCAA